MGMCNLSKIPIHQEQDYSKASFQSQLSTAHSYGVIEETWRDTSHLQSCYSTFHPTILNPTFLYPATTYNDAIVITMIKRMQN